MSEFSNHSLESYSTLRALTQRLAQESAAPAQILNDWAAEVGRWADWSGYAHQLSENISLWLPTSDEQELAILLGLTALAQALNTSPAELAERLLLLPEQPVTSLPKPTGVPKGPASPGYYAALLEQLTRWQGTFELALDEAGQHLDSETFPAQQLQDYLSRMCQVLRLVLNKEMLDQQERVSSQ